MQFAIILPVAEIIDRLTIERLKAERIPGEGRDRLDICLRLENVLGQYQHEWVEEYINKLADINGKMWDAEAAIRQGLDDDLGLEEIGRRALIIRDLNRIRVQLKNEIVELSGEGSKDVKVNYASTKGESK